MNWPDKHRPLTFKNIQGNSDSIKFLQNLARNDNSHISAILMSGPSGVGKTTAAKVFTKTR